MDKFARDFLLASGKLQNSLYKEDIESALRTPGMGGFHLLDLHDFPGQGTALVGVLDPFWGYKGYVTDHEYSRFCNSTVPLARLPKRVFAVSEKLHADLEVAHFGPEALHGAVLAWKVVTENGGSRLRANFRPQTFRLGTVSGSVRSRYLSVNCEPRRATSLWSDCKALVLKTIGISGFIPIKPTRSFPGT
jgi:hypothetical protein